MDHERVSIRTTTMSCGVMELSRINDDIEGVLYQIAGRLYHPSRGDPVAAFVFSDLTEDTIKIGDEVEKVGEKFLTNSGRLVAAIHEFKLGSIHITFPVENPKTGNFIVVYAWLIDHENFKKWYSEERVKKLKKVGT